MTEENLLFITWFRSYKIRWDRLDEAVKSRVPIPSVRLGDRHDPFGDISGNHSDGTNKTRPVRVGSVSYFGRQMEALDQPMREEAQRAFATFVKAGGSRELNCADELRSFVATCLRRSTAPEVVSCAHAIVAERI